MLIRSIIGYGYVQGLQCGSLLWVTLAELHRAVSPPQEHIQGLSNSAVAVTGMLTTILHLSLRLL